MLKYVQIALLHLSCLSFIIVYENFVTENYIIYERTIRQNACIKLNSMYLLISRYLWKMFFLTKINKELNVSKLIIKNMYIYIYVYIHIYIHMYNYNLFSLLYNTKLFYILLLLF